MMPQINQRKYMRQLPGFSLVELLTAIAVVGVLSALISLGVVRARTQAYKSTSSSNVRQIVTTLNLYALDNGGRLPDQVHPTTGQDWSGTLVEEGFLAENEVFSSPGDTFERVYDGEARSYAINSSKYTYLQNGYMAPWPKLGDTNAKPAEIALIPPNIILVGENFGGGNDGSGAVVGIAEHEGLDASTRDFYDDQGAFYGKADGSVAFRSSEEMKQYRADTDYGGDPRDPWKWKN
ncbi:type II secretion system protein [Rubellicoccus peritrichatus]|uniref:Type II secretion system protein n=1 Tax=Rubellicoccus peritrichatus TaxID=3080537 RepID=A0AAQ3LDF7_9BACT|nr:type II secretion system protein [Puniceicoccus sp. CR14]WOO41845.1 type II secretion system protein [Puniceicoccus sp. CR14]